MAQAADWLPLAIGAVAVVAVAGAGSARRRTKAEGKQGREPEGGTDPGIDFEEDGPAQGGDLGIVNLMGVSPPEKRKASREPWAVVLHQMGFSRGNDPYKYRKVTAHYTIMPDGTIAQNHPVEAWLPASHGFNQGGIAIEFAGNFPSRAGSTDPDHFWKPLPFIDKNGKQHPGFGMDQLTVEQVSSGRWLLEYLQKIVLPERGLDLTVVLAHRQSSGDRGNDPGPDVWREVGQWGVDHLGLSDGGPGFQVDSGNPIPDHWRSKGAALAGRLDDRDFLRHRSAPPTRRMDPRTRLWVQQAQRRRARMRRAA
mgnify:CR=1 FL=1